MAPEMEPPPSSTVRELGVGGVGDALIARRESGLRGEHVALELSSLDSALWIPAALAALALCAMAVNEFQCGGPSHVPWLSISEELSSLSCANLSLLCLSAAVAAALKAVEEYACPRAVATTEFNDMLHFLSKDARQRALEKLADPWSARCAMYVGPAILLVVPLGIWHHSWKAPGVYMCVHTIMIGRHSSKHLVDVALLMCRTCIQRFIDEMQSEDWTRAAAKHILLDERMESLFSGMLGFGVVLPRLARDLFLACMAGIFMVLARETYIKLLAFAVIPFSLLPCAWLLTHLSDVTCLCNRTSPRLRANHIKAAAHQAGAHERMHGREDFVFFMEYLSSTRCGVMIGGVMLTRELVLSIFARVGTYLPLLLGILKGLQT